MLEIKDLILKNETQLETLNEVIQHSDSRKEDVEKSETVKRFVKDFLNDLNNLRTPINKPTDKQLIQAAILFNDGIEDVDKLSDMVALCEWVIDRLIENNDITKPTELEADFSKGLYLS